MHTGTTYIRRWTLKTIKKKGRKWSNISVKKYHQRPVFGVRSGRVSVAPQVCGTQDQLPATNVDKPVKIPVYTENSPMRGIIFRKLFGMGLGDARWECGSLMRSRRIGSSITIEDKDRCNKKDKAKSEDEALP